MCDVYSLDGDKTKDLCIVTVKAGHKTPLQRILKGEKTVQSFMEGRGALTITTLDEEVNLQELDTNSQPKEFVVNIGEMMQWEADEAGLAHYEIYYPPYQEGRFENLNT